MQKWRWQIMFQNGRFATWDDFDLDKNDAANSRRLKGGTYHSAERFVAEIRCGHLQSSYAAAGLATPILFMVQLDPKGNMLQCHSYCPERARQNQAVWDGNDRFAHAKAQHQR